MPERRPAGSELRVEVHRCPECATDRVVQIVQLTGEPGPVAVCADCGAGVELWLADVTPERAAGTDCGVTTGGAGTVSDGTTALNPGRRTADCDAPGHRRGAA